MSSFYPDNNQSDLSKETEGARVFDHETLPENSRPLHPEAPQLERGELRKEFLRLLNQRISQILRQQIDDPYMRAMDRFTISHGPEAIDIDLATSLKLGPGDAEQFLNRWSRKFQEKLLNTIQRHIARDRTNQTDVLSACDIRPETELEPGVPRRSAFELYVRSELQKRELQLQNIYYFRLQLGFATKIIADLKVDFPDLRLPELHEFRKELETIFGFHIRFIRGPASQTLHMNGIELRRAQELEALKNNGNLVSAFDPGSLAEQLSAQKVRAMFAQDRSCEDHTDRACISIDDAKTNVIEDIQWAKRVSKSTEPRVDYVSIHVPDCRYGRSLDVGREMFTFNIGYFQDQDGEILASHLTRAIASNKRRYTPAKAEENFGTPGDDPEFQNCLDSLAHSAFARRMNRALSSNIIPLRGRPAGRVVVEEHMYTAYHLFARELLQAGIPVICKGSQTSSVDYLDAVKEVIPQATREDLLDPMKTGALLLILQEADRMDLFDEILDSLTSRNHYLVFEQADSIPISLRARFKANRLDGELNQQQALHYLTGSQALPLRDLRAACEQLNARHEKIRFENSRFIRHPSLRGVADLIGSECLGVVRFCSRGEVFVDVRQLGLSGIVPAYEMTKLGYPNLERGTLLKLRWEGPHPFRQANVFSLILD